MQDIQCRWVAIAVLLLASGLLEAPSSFGRLRRVTAAVATAHVGVTSKWGRLYVRMKPGLIDGVVFCTTVLPGRDSVVLCTAVLPGKYSAVLCTAVLPGRDGGARVIYAKQNKQNEQKAKTIYVINGTSAPANSAAACRGMPRPRFLLVLRWREQLSPV